MVDIDPSKLSFEREHKSVGSWVKTDATDEKKNDQKKLSRRKRRDSDESPPRRRRRDSDESPPRRKRRDSDESPPRRKRRDSDESPPRRRGKEKLTHTKSGHQAGLQDAEAFSRREGELRDERRRGVGDGELSGRNATTVYRDRKTGQVVEEQRDKEEIRRKREKNERAWNMGSVQLAELERKVEEEGKMKDAPFARGEEDEELEDSRKSIIHEDDPMAEFMIEKREKKRLRKLRKEGGVGEDVDVDMKVYSGPSPKPNRFKIPPGYRWDGVDRGNGFEDKLFKKISDEKVGKLRDHNSHTSDW